ncbi:delta-5 fatty acid desaturase [Capsaspora owczarzaki ATCC 30864]|uniref:Delta-5 fatty acid desaturase n=1 Tax=Capsaspora owczarzaki (strain ATCC 30864) TaxID=595528 RepID=A0A0D2X4B2_CAPO3|nr:delta-5 fatty acid desaturase [Capsaspora owczarzaki ATCC 30864]KJE95754.1 delta-5 fatty acid desaturase [Capsaspora owczarzaki ATCC 30864]|eukprot:XP_004345759.1 delta-5 fatty acid desaturase [Capsaspora owczarzaki ATCC 30864]
MPAAASASGSRTFTWEEVAKHNTPNDLYVSIRGKVYDITPFLNRHPGGVDALLTSAGRDVTQVFEMYHALDNSKNLTKFYIGDLVTNELPVFPEPSPFFVAIKQRVADYFVQTKQDPKWAPWMFVRYFWILFTVIASWYGQLFVFRDNTPVQILLAFAQGMACALIGLMPMHDASHFSITRNQTVWRVLGATHDIFNGASFLVWLYQHMLGHHPYTNIDGADPDIVTGEKDVRRIKTTQPWYSFYYNQHVYVPMLYAFLGVKTRVQDVSIMFTLRKNGAIRTNELSDYHFKIFVAGKALFVLHRIVLPLVLLPTWKFFLLFAVTDMVSSYWLALTFQANHVVDTVDWPLPDKDGRINQDWAEMQICTTQDYAHDSWFWNFFAGALNHQTTHHLFPGVSQYYYPEISPIVAKTAKEFGLPYNYKATFLEALGTHVGHLRNLGRDTNKKSK